MSDPNRREFMRHAAVLAGGLGYSAAHMPGLSANELSVDEAAILQLRGHLDGQLVLPSETSYDQAKRVFYWNPRTECKPVAIVQCGSEDDAKRAVDFARRHSLAVAVRSGGHSHLAWGSCDGLVIDLSRLKQISIDPEKRILRGQGGVLGGEAARAAGKYGLVPVFGQCPGVSATGVTLGGGLGWLAGMFGACCDNLISARLVMADGVVRDIRQKTDEDLFWAIRGAGANFGACTSFEAQLHPLGNVLGGDVFFDSKDARNVLRGFRELMNSAPDEFQATLNLTNSERGLFISLCHCGSESEAERTLETIRSFAKPTKVIVKRQTFAQLAEKAAATNPGSGPSPAFRAIQTVCRDEISDEVIDILVDKLEGAFPEAIMGLSHYVHGQVSRVSPEATAFPHRKEHSIFLRVAYNWSAPELSEDRFTWGANWLAALRPAENERVYANYQTYATSSGSRSLFMSNFERLLALKKKHDPDNFFHRNANIALA